MRAAVGDAQDAASLGKLEIAARRARAMLLVADNHGRYVWANDATARLLGYSRPSLLRMSVWDITPPASETDVEPLWRAFLRSRSQSGVYPVRCQSGRRQLMYYYAEPRLVAGLHVSAMRPVAARRRQPRRKARLGRRDAK
jgi:PAS domain S-box-containing protein